ncbi:unnamed protein product [Malus baccata var. baccata]
MFLRRCILAFNLLSFEGASHLLTSIEMYCKEAISSYPPYESPHLDASSNDLETPPEYENMELENLVFEKVTEEIEARQRAGGSVSESLIGLVEDIEVPGDPEFKHGGNREDCHYAHPTSSILSDLDPTAGLYLQTNWQIQGFLQEQADALEKQGSSFSFNAFEFMLRQLQKLAPELHHVHFLRYLNGLYHDDFFAALENAHCYFDYSSSDTTLAYLKLIQHLAVFKGYKEDFATLVEIAAAKFLSVSKSRILLLKLQLLQEHALHRGHLKLAQQVCDELGDLASSVSGMDMELKTEASLRNARTLLAANQFSEKSGNAVLGLPYALASLLFCQSFNLDLLKASATLTLAELWLSLGSSHAKMALSLVHGAFPMILGRGGLELRARAFIVEAKCYLSDPSFSISGSLDDVLDSLRQASNELQSIARVGTLVNGCENASGVQYHKLAAEAFYLMAMVFDKLGRIEDFAASFKQHILALENPQDEEDPLIFEGRCICHLDQPF